MKIEALAWLACPDTRSPLALDGRRWQGKELMEGFLIAADGRRYPVIEGVPRLLPDALLSDLPHRYPAFFERYSDWQPPAAATAERDLGIKRRLQASSDWEWQHHPDVCGESLENWLPEGTNPHQLFSSGTGLEFGCTAGRHSGAIAELAGTHFAVDLSCAVDQAFRRHRDQPNCHVVQADANHLPFRPGAFDYVVALGVLHQLPDPAAAFSALAQHTREDGMLVANIDQDSRPLAQSLLNGLRRLVKDLPLETVQQLSVLFALLDRGLLIAPWQVVAALLPGPLQNVLIPERARLYARHDFKTLVADWFERLSCPSRHHLSRDQLVRWYREQGFAEVQVTPYWQAVWNGAGRRKAVY